MVRSVLMSALMIAAVPAGASAAMSWTFDSDSEGWGTLNDARDFAWDGSLGQPAGAVKAVDRGTGILWYFSAPIDQIGDATPFYGALLTWDILGIAGNQTSLPTQADVMLVGGGIQIGVNVSVSPALGQWTSVEVTLADGTGWQRVNSLSSGALSATAATAADFQAVLGDLQGFYIRGEYTNTGGDSTALDNVRIVPAPAAVSMLALSGLAAARRRR